MTSEPLIDSYLIDTGYACYWIEMVNDRVVKAPPIAKWMIFKHYDSVWGWIIGHGFSMVKV
jgi:hypothetical protein